MLSIKWARHVMNSPIFLTAVQLWVHLHIPNMDIKYLNGCDSKNILKSCRIHYENQPKWFPKWTNSCFFLNIRLFWKIYWYHMHHLNMHWYIFDQLHKKLTRPCHEPKFISSWWFIWSLVPILFKIWPIFIPAPK